MEPSPATSTTGPAPDRLPWRQKVGYGMGAFVDLWGHWLYPSLCYQVFNIFLGVAPGLVGTVQMLKILLEAASDAFFGWRSDNARTRFGRRRPFILIGGTLAGLCLPLLFAVPVGWSDTQYFWFMLTSLALYVPMVACFNLPWQSLGSELTPDYHERTSVLSIRNAVQKLPEAALFFALQFTTLDWFRRADGTADVLQGAQVFCSIAGGIMVIASWCVFLSVRERHYARVSAQQSSISLGDSILGSLKCKPVRILITVVLGYGTGTAMVATLGYYTTVYHVCAGDLVRATRWNTAMGACGMIAGLIAIPFFAKLARRFGKKTGILTALAMALVAFGTSWWLYRPDIPALQLVVCSTIAFTGVGFWTLYHSALADAMDFDELEQGKRREGSIFATQGWISKIGMALGSGASGWILQSTGFDASLPAQSPETLTLIRLLLAGIPMVGLLTALVAALRLPLTPEVMANVRQKLEARRGLT